MTYRSIVIVAAILGAAAVGSAWQKAKVISDSEPNVLIGKALGWQIKMESPVVVHTVKSKWTNRRPMTLTSTYLWMKNANLKSKDHYELQPCVDRTTSQTFPIRSSSRYGLDSMPNRKFGIGYEGTADDRISFNLKFVRYRTYEEEIVMKNVKFTSPVGKRYSQKGIYAIASCSNRKIATPSGLSFTVIGIKEPTVAVEGSISLRLLFDRPADNSYLPESPLCRETGKPVRIIGGKSWGFQKDRRTFDISIQIPEKSQLKNNVEPVLKFKLVQRADLAEESIRLVAPTRIVKTYAELTKNFAKARPSR